MKRRRRGEEGKDKEEEEYSFFSRTVITDWNTLPFTTRSLSSVNSFRNSLHRMVSTGDPSC